MKRWRAGLSSREMLFYDTVTSSSSRHYIPVFVGNKAKGWISQWGFEENKACQIFRKTNISYPPWWRTCTYKTPVSRFPLLPYYRRLSFDFPSEWPKNKKILKIRNTKFVHISNFPLLYALSERYLLPLSALFCPNNMEGSKRTTFHIGHLCSSTKKSKK